MVTQTEKEAFSNRLNALLDSVDFPAKGSGRQIQLSKLFGVSQKGARKWLESEAIPRHDKIIEISSYFNCNPVWLEYGEEEANLLSKAVSEYVPVSVMGKGSNGSSEPVAVPSYETQAAAGGGKQVYSEEPNGTIYFVKGWLDSKGLNAKFLIAVEADGDSMMDYIHDGDTVLVDTSNKDIESGKVYVFRHDSDLRIKRLFKNLNGSVTIKSDNESDSRYISETLDAADLECLAIIGLVVWRGG